MYHKNSKIKCNKTLSVITFEKHYLEFKYLINAIYDSLPVEKKAGKSVNTEWHHNKQVKVHHQHETNKENPIKSDNIRLKSVNKLIELYKITKSAIKQHIHQKGSVYH